MVIFFFFWVGSNPEAVSGLSSADEEALFPLSLFSLFRPPFNAVPGSLVK